jgi:hypothetical protein
MGVIKEEKRLIDYFWTILERMNKLLVSIPDAQVLALKDLRCVSCSLRHASRSVFCGRSVGLDWINEFQLFSHSEFRIRHSAFGRLQRN